MPCRISRLASTASLNRLTQLTAADQDREPEGRKRNIRKRATAGYHIPRFSARVCTGSACLRRSGVRLVGVFEPAAGGGLRGACKRPGKSGASRFVWIGKVRQSLQSMISRLRLVSERHSRRAGLRLSTSGTLSGQKAWDAPREIRSLASWVPVVDFELKTAWATRRPGVRAESQQWVDSDREKGRLGMLRTSAVERARREFHWRNGCVS